ncbi:U3 small nucleolar RNA-associated protein 14 homolog A isoform X2 [Enoplosus armatus]|uniref:U3 small nucleolar RNA-associated protein 14 homolog A isoform X2 n=1 Tax=Enoplosus armatus TaxID=215367 RepID=UPI0039927EE4
MAKVSKKKVSKKNVKKAPAATDKSAAARPDVVYVDDDDDDEEGGLNEADENITSEEEEDGGDEDERKRRKLLEAISALDGKRKKKLAERSEAAVQMSEFTVNAEGEGDKIDLSDLIGSMDKNPAVPAKTKKQLKNLQQSKKTIECPLSKQESERIQRDVSFQKAAKEVTRWKDIIKQNQRAEQLVFPLNQEPPGPKPMERVVSSWKAQTPLEQEIFALLSANKQPINDPVLTPAEEASVRAMSLEEAKIRRAELQKARALQSYYEAKSRRERKIKSKKYHKVHNKAKRKEFLKRFDEMVKTDPAAALEELNKIELARMQERMSLKHQNSGKWAKSKAIMAKYDEGARKAMQQQLEVNKDLTQKLVTSLNNEEEEEEEEEEAGDAEVLPDFVNDAERGPDSANPWMRGKLSDDPTEKEISDTVDLTAERPGAVGGTVDEEEEEEEEEGVEETEEEALLREFDSRRELRRTQEADTVPVMSVDGDEEEEEAKTPAEDPDASDKEEEELSEFTSLFRGIAEAKKDEATADTSHTDTSAPLEEGLMRIRTPEDVELLSQETPPATETLPSATEKAGKNRKRKRGIELQEVLTKETKVIQVPLAPTVEDAEDSDEMLDQTGLIKEAFAGDDVISDFLKDKRKQEDEGKPKEVDLTLPGWGEWGGTGLKPPRNKRRRFRIKAPPAPPRKDRHLPSVIMSEARSGSLAPHQVSSLPFPFESHAQFESTIRSPMGRTWVTERTAKKISKPKVVTQLGAIIEPMSREELMKDKRQVPAGSKASADSRKNKTLATAVTEMLTG